MDKIFAVLLPVLLAACGFSDEAASKREYSIVQHYEYEYRDKPNNQPYILAEKALGSDYLVIGFPIEGANSGYVFMVANPRGKPYVKAMPDVPFVVTEVVLEDVQSKAEMADAVKAFISSHVGH